MLLEVLGGLLVLETDELDELVVRDQALFDRDGPRTRVRPRVVHRHLEIHEAEARAAIALRHRSTLGERAAVHVEPAAVAEAGGLHLERIALPAAGGVAEPPGLRIVGWKRPAVGEDLP